jgi:hypothetical protein
LRPFQAVRYDPAQAGDLSTVICPPYDDIGPARARSLRVRPHHIARLLHATDPQTGAGQLDRWRRRGVLVRDTRPAVYVYQQQRGGRILQRGLIGELGLTRGRTSAVLPHEDVQPHVVKQRAGSMAGLRAQLEPLLLTYRSTESTTAQIVDHVTRRPPVAVARTGALTHTLWACTAPDEQVLISAAAPQNDLVRPQTSRRARPARHRRTVTGPPPTPHPHKEQSPLSLSQLADRPTAPAEQPAPSAPRPGRADMRRARAQRARKTSLLARYVGYVGYFVGAGLISGAVVHHPLDPARYTRIAAYGVLVFLAATVLNEFFLARNKPGLPRMLLVIGASLLLSFGIGMLSGGLQHFEDFPARGAMLIPLGITVSFVAYVVKDAETSWRRIFSPVGLAVLLTALISFAGLRYVAVGMGEQPEGGGHSHGSAEEEEAEQDQPHEPAPTAGTSQPETGPTDGVMADEPGHDDGHAH